jgi:transcriptional regulator with XRE-family HTH domain
MPKPKKTRGEIIRARREAAGWSQGELAIEAGLARTTVNAAESKQRVGLACLEKIAAALGVGVKELLP